ncbi:Coiled-coil domain-containing protein 63 [Borealophlyctis nickersoniae]|nr:Coiled-coil domain-containing protein 63 [Borealophlyctis nickersoniae]
MPKPALEVEMTSQKAVTGFLAGRKRAATVALFVFTYLCIIQLRKTHLRVNVNRILVPSHLAEIELQKLQRQYRIMEGDRKAYSEESRILITKQRATIDKLKRDNYHLMEKLRLLETRTEDRRRIGIQSKQAEALAEQAETFNRKIRAIINDITELDEAIALIDRDIDQQRADLGGVNAAMQNSEAIEKQIRILENRLDKALVKFNKSLAVNKRLRSTIDNLRRERLVFDTIYRKFERELMEQKKTMAEIIEMSNSAYEARDEAQTKILALREKADKEYQAYMQEMKELDRSLEQDRKLKEFMATKASERHGPADAEGGGGMHHKKGAKDKDGISRTGFGSQDTLAESLETYEKAFAQIREVTGTPDIGELVARFKAVEDQNFSLFNYVNEVNNDIEKMAEEIVEVQRKIDALTVEGVRQEEERRVEMKELEESLNTCNEKAAQYEKQYNEITYLVGELRKGTEHLVTKFQSVHAPAATTPAPTTTGPLAATSATGGMGISPVDALSEDTAVDSAAHFVEGVSTEPLHPPTGPIESTDEAPQAGATPALAPSESLAPSTPSTAKPAQERKTVDFTIPTEAILGSHGVTDTNLLQCLGLVEHKTNELLTLYYLINAPKKSGGSAGGGEEKEGVKEVGGTAAVGGLLGQGPAAPIGTMAIIAPSTGDEHDDDDIISEEDDRPLTREELRQRTLRGLSKRERTANAPKAVNNKSKRKATKKVDRD